mmetsp:Transcript_11440/g.24479  ORF Transcript_11440/g.24479 Transcript_11440/m.24479 type:complete len:215 (+) Transcript_11440:414-1058(+)|eukprot:6210276-Pleurochrysis_carterae.AAC.4
MSDTMKTAELTDKELIKEYQAKQAELEALKAKMAEAPTLDEHDMSRLDFSRVRHTFMWVPPFVALWTTGYLKDFDFFLGLVCFAAAGIIGVIIEVYKLLRAKKLAEEEKAASTAAFASTGSKSSKIKKGVPVSTDEAASAKKPTPAWDPGAITYKVWLPPFLVLWCTRHNFTELEFGVCVLALIATLKFGQYAVRRFEKSDLRAWLREGPKKKK